VCFLGMAVMRLMYLLDSVVGSNFFIWSYRFDFCHSFCAVHFRFSLNAHFIAVLLCGNGFLSMFGSFSALLLPSVIPFLACSSTCSLPSIPLCPGDHLIDILSLRCFLHSLVMCSCSASNMWCPVAGFVSCVAVMTA